MRQTPYFWQGEWIDSEECEKRALGLETWVNEALPMPLKIEVVLDAANAMSLALEQGSDRANALRAFLVQEKLAPTEAEARLTLAELAEFLARGNLAKKIHRELSLGAMKSSPFHLERLDYRANIFEAWAPLGFLVHIAPSNAVNVPFLSVLEGLLTGNVNFLKTGGNDPIFPQLCLEFLVEMDTTRTLARYIIAARIPSQRQDLLKAVLRAADGIAAWGSEEAIAGVRALAPPAARIIAWGPKISFAYIAASELENTSLLEQVAREICTLDQQACASPQVLYLETADRQTINGFAAKLAAKLETISPGIPADKPGDAESAEIRQTVAVINLERALDGENNQTVWEAKDRSWRVLVDGKPGLRASPLFRTVWVKPLLREEIAATLRPLRHYLQTVGLAATGASINELARKFFHAGALRIRPIGSMLGGYMGEPHDGEYALARYSRRVCLQDPSLPPGISCLEDLEIPDPKQGETNLARLARLPIIGKEEVAAAQAALKPEDVEIFFRSGGSSGEPKLSIFTYDDYETQMKLAAQGLYAAGLNPMSDRCMNLFFSGGLYGGFLSFFSILEELKAVQFPMAAEPDLSKVAEAIVKQKVNVLLGMPSYLWKLFEENASLLASYAGVQKIFYGGEHFSPQQKQALEKNFGVSLVKSAAYGSNDTGPMGFQCRYCEGGVHHVHDRLQTIEIVEMEKDKPVEAGAVGRLLLSSKVRRGQAILRYEIGDLGRWVRGDCSCGRKSPRFELLGRYGDVFRVGTMFLNYRRLEQIIGEIPGFSGLFQIIVEANEKMTLQFSSARPIDADMVRSACLKFYPELHTIMVLEKLASFFVLQVEAAALEYAPGSGKLRSVVDRRKN